MQYRFAVNFGTLSIFVAVANKRQRIILLYFRMMKLCCTFVLVLVVSGFTAVHSAAQEPGFIIFLIVKRIRHFFPESVSKSAKIQIDVDMDRILIQILGR